VTTGEWVYRLGKRCAADFIALLDQVLRAFPAAPVIIMICDNDSIHHARTVTSYLETHPRLELLYGAWYSPHDNPVDSFLLQRFDVDSYLREVLRQYLLSGGTSNSGDARIRAGKVWSREFDRRRSMIINIALNSGFSSYRAGAPNKVDSAVIDKLAALTPSDAIAELGIGRST
jgi:hypothetical protein